MSIKNQFIATLALCGVVAAAAPTPRADAAVILFVMGVFGAPSLNDGPSLGQQIAIEGSMGLGAAGIAVGMVGICLGWTPALAPLMALGVDGSVHASTLQAELSTRYPFIQNSDVINSTVALIQKKAQAQQPVNGKIVVSLSRGEITDLLAQTDAFEVHAAGVEKMIQDLK